MADIIRFPKDRIKNIRLAVDNPTPKLPREEIVSQALTALFIELNKHDIPIDNPKFALRRLLLRRILHEIINEVNGQPMSDYMKKLTLII